MNQPIIQEPLTAVVPTRADDIRMRLAAIDTQTGMSRSSRECFIAAGMATPYLSQLEAEAATLRAELAGL